MWYIYALLGPAIWALLNHLDKYLLGRFFKLKARDAPNGSSLQHPDL
jgi:hypothetical protein